MTNVSLSFKAGITDLILKAKRYGEITQPEADYLISMAVDSAPAAATIELLRKKKVPDFPYAALHFATMIWRQGDAEEDDIIARAGYMLAQFVLTQELHEQDTYWAAKLLREIYISHD